MLRYRGLGESDGWCNLRSLSAPGGGEGQGEVGASSRGRGGCGCRAVPVGLSPCRRRRVRYSAAAAGTREGADNAVDAGHGCEQGSRLRDGTPVRRGRLAHPRLLPHACAGGRAGRAGRAIGRRDHAAYPRRKQARADRRARPRVSRHADRHAGQQCRPARLHDRRAGTGHLRHHRLRGLDAGSTPSTRWRRSGLPRPSSTTSRRAR